MASLPGIDLIEIERIESALERRPGLEERLFRPGEAGYARGRRRPGRHLAARFAAKEAAVKALGTAAGADLAIPLRDIEIVSGPPPRIRLHGIARQEADKAGVRLEVSMTHSRDLAAAVVTASPAR